MIRLLALAALAVQPLPSQDPVDEALRDGIRLRVLKECDDRPRETWAEWCRFNDRFRRIETERLWR